MPARKKRKLPADDSLSPAVEPPLHPVLHWPAADLARHLLSDTRLRPAVVVAVPPQPEQARFDASVLAARLGPDTDVFEIATGSETYTLGALLPKDTQVYGSAVRVYSADLAWTAEPGLSPLRMVQDQAAVERLSAQVVSDVGKAAKRASAPLRRAAPKPFRATASVKGFAAQGSRAIVVLNDDGHEASIHAEDLVPGVPLDWVLSKGQVLTGVHHPTTGTFDIRSLLHRPAFSATYRHGQLALARVSSVSPTQARLKFWPGTEFSIGIDHISSNELDSAQDLLTEGEVVCVRVLFENGAVMLSMLDVDDDEAVIQAPSLIPGGPPWLSLDRPYAGIFTAPPTGSDPAGFDAGAAANGAHFFEPVLSPAERKTALQSTQYQLVAARHTIAALQKQLDQRGATDAVARALQDQVDAERKKADELGQRYNEVFHRVEGLKAELARVKANLVDAKRRLRTTSSRTESETIVAFAAPAEQFRHEVYVTWADTVSPGDKAAQFLRDYTIGPEFLATLAALPARRRTKVLRAVVDLVANREGPLRNREPHPLRQNDGALAPPQMRGDDVCWRLYVEQKASAALRLHYWKLKDGGVELSRVVGHGDVKP
jgi:hypothetical protein